MDPSELLFVRRCCASAATGAPGQVGPTAYSSIDRTDLIARTVRAKETAVVLYEKLWAARSVCATLSRDDFSGHAMLPQEDQDILPRLLHLTTELISLHNDVVTTVECLHEEDRARRPENRLSIDLPQLK